MDSPFGRVRPRSEERGEEIARALGCGLPNVLASMRTARRNPSRPVSPDKRTPVAGVNVCAELVQSVIGNCQHDGFPQEASI